MKNTINDTPNLFNKAILDANRYKFRRIQTKEIFISDTI